MKEKLPDGWEWKKLEDIAVNETNAIVDGPFGSNLKLSDYIENEEIPVISTLNIENGFDKDKLRYISFEKFETIKRSAIKPGDIVMAKIGSCGKCTFYPEWMPIGIIPANLLKITVSKDIDKKYVYYYFKSQVFKNNLNGITKTTAQPAFNISSFKKLPIPLPPLDVQQKIVSILEKAEETKRLRAQADELTQQLLKSVFLEMFGDPVKNEKGWTIRKVGEVIASIEAGWSANGEHRLRIEDEYGVLKVSAVTQGFFLPEEHKAIKESIDLKKVVTPEKGDVIFSRANTLELVGATCLIRKNYPKLLLPDKLWKIRVNTDLILPEVFKFILAQHSMRAEISKKSTGTSGSMYNISMAKLQSISIPVPALKVQEKFVMLYGKFENISEQQAQSSQEINILFDSLMQKAFTGELVS